MTHGPPAEEPGDGGRVTPLGARRTSVPDLQREVERLTAALQQAEQRRPDAPPPRRRLRRTALIGGLLAGLLLVTDGVLTVLWQEPVTAFEQARSQAALRDDLQDLRTRFTAAPAVGRAGPSPRATAAHRMRRQATALLHARPAGGALATLEIPRIGLETVVVESTGHEALTKGPGHYRGTVLPGMDGTVGLAGHRTTYGAPFRHLDDLRAGSRIVLRMPYGRFVYRVSGTAITTADDAASLRSRPGTPRLVLTACHPLYSAAQRIVVSARLVSATPA